MNRKRILSITVLLMLAITGTEAKVRLPHILGDNMVIQQQTDVRLWGWAQPGRQVKVSTSWSKESVTAKAGRDGKWLVRVKSPAASYQPLEITFDDGDPLTLHNVLSGEVWVCAGQSNMEMPVKGFNECPIDNYNQTVIDARQHPGVRSVKLPAVMRALPQDDAQCEWRVCEPKTVGDFSATGYFFARQLNTALDIPVGIIEANRGGTRLESWLTKETLEKYTDEPTDSAAIFAAHPDNESFRGMLWGNGTFNPILNYTVKGILYYQGCSNVGTPEGQYSERMKLLVGQWRQQFGLGDLPFYFVEIAPYSYLLAEGDWAARLREEQYKASKEIANSYLICTNDLVYPNETEQIHPAQKRQVGERLAYAALARDYGFEGIQYRFSCYKDMQVKQDAILIHLDDNYHTDSPLEGMQGFEVAGDDRVFHPAKAEHFSQPGGGYWDTALRISSPDVPKPVAVRYCFRNFQVGNVKNGANLPLYPFRTDNWELIVPEQWRK